MKVLVFGGTHGNEWTGVYVVTKYAEYFKQKFPKLDLHFILANPEAHKINKRFKDEDLNRAFQFLKETRPHSYEHKRAGEIKKMIDEGPCYVIDLHTTTSNMGKTVIVSDYNPLNLYLSSVLSQGLQDCRIIGSPDPQKKYLATQSHQSMMIEVGPVPNNVIEGRVLEGTLEVLETVLKTIADLPPKLGGSFELYEEIEDVKYPQNEKKEIAAYIHPEFQGRDFTPLRGEFTAFRTFSGENISRTLSEELFPIFINEAAYYPQQQAYTLCRKKRVSF